MAGSSTFCFTKPYTAGQYEIWGKQNPPLKGFKLKCSVYTIVIKCEMTDAKALCTMDTLAISPRLFFSWQRYFGNNKKRLMLINTCVTHLGASSAWASIYLIIIYSGHWNELAHKCHRQPYWPHTHWTCSSSKMPSVWCASSVFFFLLLIAPSSKKKNARCP